MEMISLVCGISIQRTLDPESWTPGQIASLIAREVREMDLSRLTVLRSGAGGRGQSC